mmetsp:Transcript_40626/g.126646  ORF Transcript_40626/g.126646 Transcript_40626/m.126646 type:complete len:376 (-) Transcript_40626:489-1616(-)
MAGLAIVLHMAPLVLQVREHRRLQVGALRSGAGGGLAGREEGARKDQAHLLVVDLLEVQLQPLDPALQAAAQLPLLRHEPLVHAPDLALAAGLDPRGAGEDLLQRPVHLLLLRPVGDDRPQGLQPPHEFGPLRTPPHVRLRHEAVLDLAHVHGVAPAALAHALEARCGQRCARVHAVVGRAGLRRHRGLALGGHVPGQQPPGDGGRALVPREHGLEGAPQAVHPQPRRRPLSEERVQHLAEGRELLGLLPQLPLLPPVAVDLPPVVDVVHHGQLLHLSLRDREPRDAGQLRDLPVALLWVHGAAPDQRKGCLGDLLLVDPIRLPDLLLFRQRPALARAGRGFRRNSQPRHRCCGRASGTASGSGCGCGCGSAACP